MLTRDRLKDLDAEAELVKQVEETIEALEKHVMNHGPDCYKLAELQHATSQNLLKRLSVVEALADRVDTAGETDLAEITYIRVLSIYRGQPLPVRSFICPLLMKMASFYWRTDQPLRAEKCWWDIFELRDPPGQAQSIENEVWQSLGVSLAQTSGIIRDALRLRYPDLFPTLNLETPFPPIHRMIRSEYTSAAPHGLYRRDFPSNNAVSSSSHATPTSDEGYILEIIQQIPDIDLATRDVLSRTPLFLAALLKQEDAGHALMMLIAALPSGLQHQHMNARDLSGQTILGIAILSSCSRDFIKTLIDNGADIEPDTLMKEPLTPLQAACMTGNLDIVALLLDYGADVNRVYPGHATPTQLSQVVGNDKIMQLINEKTQSLYSSNAPISTRHRSLGGDITKNAYGYSPSPSEETPRLSLKKSTDILPTELLPNTPINLNEYLHDGDENEAIDG
jgi:hypothetical protein